MVCNEGSRTGTGVGGVPKLTSLNKSMCGHMGTLRPPPTHGQRDTSENIVLSTRVGTVIIPAILKKMCEVLIRFIKEDVTQTPWAEKNVFHEIMFNTRTLTGVIILKTLFLFLDLLHGRK